MAFDPITQGALVGGALSGGASLLGGMMTNSSNAKRAAEAMEFEARQSKQNLVQQAFMSNTAHQREVTDLRAAGLNPILSATGGPGAPVGGGSSGKGIAIPAVDSLGNATSSAQAGARNTAELRNIETTNRAIKMKTGLDEAQLWLAKDQAKKTQQETATEKALTSIYESRAKGEAVEGEIDSTRYGAALRYIDRGVRAATGAASAFRNIGGSPATEHTTIHRRGSRVP